MKNSDMAMLPPSNYPRPQYGPGDIPCPQCGQPAGKPVKFTMWGGLVGPRLINLTQCQACRFEFNSKTGLSTKKAVWAYRGVTWGVALVFLAIWWLLSHSGSPTP